MTPLEELQHVLFGQLTHGNPTSDLECILDALTEAKAQGVEEGAQLAENGRFLHNDAPDAKFGRAVSCLLRTRAAQLREVQP